jgi:high-affinity nickel-transport protein
LDEPAQNALSVNTDEQKMMESLPHDWLALITLVFFLGLKHGVDPDHLVTIDGMARFNAVRRPRLARLSGLLFSLGHGAVVTLIAAVVATVAREWQAPQWLELTGAGISIAFLLALAGANLVAVRRARPGEMVRTVGLKSRLLGRLVETSHPAVMASVGAAFALSFDTISQAMLFSITGSSLAGWMFAAALGLVFTAGMIATDTVNGYCMSRLIQRADRRAAIASRIMSLAVAALSLAVAGLGIARLCLPALDANLESAGLTLGVAVVVAMILAFALAMRSVQRQGVRA